jgi:PAS domain-containing protein
MRVRRALSGERSPGYYRGKLRLAVERSYGVRRCVMVYPHPLRVATGGLIEAVNMLVDITDRKKAETALRESEAFVCVTSVVGQTRSSLKVLIASSAWFSKKLGVHCKTHKRFGQHARPAARGFLSADLERRAGTVKARRNLQSEHGVECILHDGRRTANAMLPPEQRGPS